MLILFILQSPEGTTLSHRRFQPPQKQRYNPITSEVSTSVSLQHLPYLLVYLGTSSYYEELMELTGIALSVASSISFTGTPMTTSPLSRYFS